MISEQLDLAVLKRLMDNAKYLKTQLHLMGENLDNISKERDELAEQAQTKYAAILSDQKVLKKQHLDEIQVIRTQLQNEIDLLSRTKQAELDNTVRKYEDKLQATVKSYEEKIANVSKELQAKNDKLQEELKQTKENYQAVTNRIRGISS